MADRQVKVIASVQATNYLSGMDQMARKTKDVTKAAEEQSAALKSLGQTGGIALAAIGVAAAGVATLAIAKYAEFDQAMSFVAATGKDAKDNQDALRDAAIRAGAATVFSATESANAIEEMAKAGVEAKDILAGGLTGALNLAAAGGLGVADAAGIAGTALKQFALDGKDMNHVADLLSAGAGKAMGSVEDLSQGLKFVGPVAHGMGVSIDETVGVLAEFASQGILADQAGTGLRGMLSSLTSPSTLAKKELDALGVSLYDGSGKFLGLANMAGQLENAYKGMSDQQKDTSLGVIFGNQQITAARIVLDQGRAGVERWTDAVNDQGFAARTAAERLDNLRGDIEQLGGALDTALIKMGSAADGVLRSLVQTVTDAVTAFGELPSWVQGTTFVVIALTGAIGLLSGGFLLLLPRIMETGAALAVLSTSQLPGVAVAATAVLAASRGLMLGLVGLARFLTGPWGIALGVAALSIAALVKTMSAGAPTADELTNALQHTTNAAKLLRVASKQDSASKFFWGDYTDALKDLPGLLERINNDGWDMMNLSFRDQGAKASIERLGGALGELASRDMPAAQSQFKGLTEQYHLSRAQQLKMIETMGPYRAALIAQATALGINVTTGSKAENQNNLLKLALGGTTVATDASTRAVQEQAAATEETTKAQEDWAKMVSDSDASFVDLQGALDTIIQKNKDVATATADSTKSSKDSWKDYYDGVSFSLDKYLKELQSQVDAQTDWEKNMILLSGRASQGMIDELAKLGPAGAPLVAALVNGTDEELAKAEGLWAQRGGEAPAAYADALSGSADVIKAASAQLGKGAAEEIATKLANGTATVQQIIAEYGLKISSLKPKVIVEVGSNTDPATRALNEWLTANANHKVHIASSFSGGQVDHAASGGTVTGVGTSKSDSNLYALSVGEEIIQEPFATRYRPILKQMNAGMFPGYANGGTVGFQPAPVYTPAPPRQYMPGPGAALGGNRSVSNTIYANNVDTDELLAKMDNRSNWSLRRLM